MLVGETGVSTTLNAVLELYAGKLARTVLRGPRYRKAVGLPNHPLAVLAGRMPWAQIEGALAPAFARRSRQGEVVCGSDLFGTTRELAGAGVSAAGRPRLPIRLMAALLYLKHAFNLSDEELVARWSENVVWQYFSGQEYYTPQFPCDATQIGRFRTTIGEAGVLDSPRRLPAGEHLQLFPDHRLVVIPDAGHFIYVEQPERYVSEIRDFLK